MKTIIIFLSIIFLLSTLQVNAQEIVHDPIVIVPGTMASWNTDVLFDPTPDTPEVSLEDWSFVPGTKQYDQLVKALEDKGLEENSDFFVAYYDWRQHNENSAKNYLIPIIDKALAHSESGKIDIVAHSMGGLVARAYIQSDSYRDDIDQFIMLGTPNHGSGDVYTLWEGGSIPDNWDPLQKFALNSYNWYLQLNSETAEDLYDTIHTYVPSVRELLPTYDYLTKKETGELIPFEEMQERNFFLEHLNGYDAFDFANRVRSGIYTIAGTGVETVGDIPVVPHTEEDGKLWVDGKPDPETPQKNNAEGDNRVLVSSAFLEDDFPVPVQRELRWWEKMIASVTKRAVAGFWFDQREIESTHGTLPTTAIDHVFEILGLGEPEGTYDVIPEPDQVLSFWFASPVAVKVTDPVGRSITSERNEIPGATYDGQEDPLGFKMVLIENPVSGNYTVELTGLADGSYHFATAHFGDGPEAIQTVEKSVTLNEKIAYTVTFDAANSSPILISDPLVPEEETPATPLSLVETMLEQLTNFRAEGTIPTPAYAQLRAPLSSAHRGLFQAQELFDSSRPQKERNILTLKRFALVHMNNFLASVERNKTSLSIEIADEFRSSAQIIIELLTAEVGPFRLPPVASPLL